MREFKNILTHQILALKNTIKVAFVKYTGPVIVSIIGVGFLLYYLFAYLSEVFSGTFLDQNSNFLIFIKALYIGIGMILLIMSLSIIILSYKKADYIWNSSKVYPISSDKIFISCIIYYLSIIMILMSLIVLFISYIMKISLILAFLFIVFLFMILVGNIIMSMYIYKIINLRFRSKLSFYISTITTLIIIYLSNCYFFDSKSFEVVKLTDYLTIMLPLIIGILIAFIIRKKQIKFYNLNEQKKSRMITTKLFLKLRNPYIGIILIECYRNVGYYIEFLIMPYLLYLVFYILNMEYDYSSITSMLSVVFSIPIGMYYSYNSINKLLNINMKKMISLRIVFASIIMSINYLIFASIDSNLVSLNYYLDCILSGIFIALLLTILKVPTINSGKENPIFYIVSCLSIYMYKAIICVFSKVLESYFSYSINLNYVTLVINIILIIYIYMLFGKDRD